MRLVQKNLKHTGYAVLTVHKKHEYVEVTPLFTADYLLEGEEIRKGLEEELKIPVSLTHVYSADGFVAIKELQDFKQKYGALPRNCVEEIRTGFRSGDGLTQSLPRFVYK